MFQIERNAQSVIYPLRALDNNDNPVEGLAYNTSGLEISLKPAGAANWSTLSLVLGIAGLYADSGFVEANGGDGWYELGIPDSQLVPGKTTEVRVKTPGNDNRYGAIAATASPDVYGSGSVSYDDVLILSGGLPVDGAAVWITTDEPGTNVVAGTVFTLATGRLVQPLMLDPGSYFQWVSASGHNFPNPTPITVPGS